MLVAPAAWEASKSGVSTGTSLGQYSTDLDLIFIFLLVLQLFQDVFSSLGCSRTTPWRNLASLGLPRKIALIHLKIKGNQKAKAVIKALNWEWLLIDRCVGISLAFSQISISRHINIAVFNCNDLVACFIFNLQII